MYNIINLIIWDLFNTCHVIHISTKTIVNLRYLTKINLRKPLTAIWQIAKRINVYLNMAECESSKPTSQISIKSLRSIRVICHPRKTLLNVNFVNAVYFRKESYHFAQVPFTTAKHVSSTIKARTSNNE